jgi:hypothetical protein
MTPAPGAEHYRELAASLRDLAKRCMFPQARLELVQLALKFEQRAERLENRRRVR